MKGEVQKQSWDKVQKGVHVKEGVGGCVKRRVCGDVETARVCSQHVHAAAGSRIARECEPQHQ
jgi:hypothetical protein